MKIKDVYILVTQKQFNWYGRKLIRMGIDPIPFVKEKIAELGYANYWFKGAAITTVAKVEGLKCIDFRGLRNSLSLWTRELYKELCELNG